MPFDTPENINIVNSDDGVKRVANVEPANTCPTSGGALSVNQTNPSAIRDGVDSSIRATIYDTIPASGEINYEDNPQLVVAHNYAVNCSGDYVPFESEFHSEDGDCGGYRLKVDSHITGINGELNKYAPRVYQTTTPITFNTINEIKTMYTYAGSGQIDFIAVKTENSNFTVILEVDNVEIYEISISDLKNVFEFFGDLYGVNTFTYDVGKGFIDAYPAPLYFFENFTLKVKRTGSLVKDVTGVFIKYRIKID